MRLSYSKLQGFFYKEGPITCTGGVVFREFPGGRVTLPLPNLEYQLFVTLLHRVNCQVSYDDVIMALYHDRFSRIKKAISYLPDEEPEQARANISVCLCKLRAKLLPLYVAIETNWGTGLRMHIL